MNVEDRPNRNWREGHSHERRVGGIEQYDSLIFRSDSNGGLLILDQRKIPGMVYVDARVVDVHFELIKGLGVRGAPALGEVIDRHAYSLATRRAPFETLKAELSILGAARPTATNLPAEVKLILEGLTAENYTPEIVMERALGRIREARELSDRIAENGQPFIHDGDTVMTICNTGELVGGQSALMVFKMAHENGKKINGLPLETRPFLQGARLTTWELDRWGISYRLLHDSLAGYIMKTKKVDSVWVGTDRMVRDGFANKVGTYALAVLARAHGIPFYVVGPYTSIDRYNTLGDLQELLEDRGGLEVRNNVVPRIPDKVPVIDLAFDLTEINYVDHFILDSGAYTPEEYQAVFDQLAPT